MNSSKICAECGADLNSNELYDQELFKKSKILRLVPCVECGAEAADTYCEQDGVLLLMDVILLKKKALRHLLFNRDNNSSVLLKLAILTVICDGYILWKSAEKENSEPKHHKHHLDRESQFFEQEFSFYLACGKALLAFATYFLITFFLVSFSSKQTSSSEGKKKRSLAFGLLLAYSTRFARLAAFLWSTPSIQEQQESEEPLENGLHNIFETKFMWIFVYVLFFSTTLKVIQVCDGKKAGKNLLHSAAAALIAHLGFSVVLNLDQILQSLRCIV